VLEEIGRHAAPVPYLATVVLGAMPIAEFGTPAQRQRFLPGVIDGSLILTAALVEAGAEPDHPTTTATPRDPGGGWVLDGTKICVPAGTGANYALVPATTPGDGVAVYMVDLASPGVTRTRLDTTSGEPEARLDLAQVAVTADDRLGGAGVVDWMVERATAGLCSTMVGVCDKAVALTAEYTKTRQQFDKPIASFQAVGQRAADAYIDTEAVRLTARQAAWRIDTGLAAAKEVAVAKFWAADGGQRVVHAAQHLHGGIGVDRDYPLHRCFLWAKQIELTLGGATSQLRRLGAILAAEPA